MLMPTQPQKSIYLLDRSLKVDVYFEPDDRDFKDNICISFCEECPDNEKIFVADETNMFISVEQARHLAEILINAANESETSSESH
jgi:hypothetical protein